MDKSIIYLSHRQNKIKCKTVIISIFSTILLLLILFGCQNENSINKIPSKEEVKVEFTRADALLNMFCGTGLAVEESDKYIDEENHIYYAVKYENINSLDDLKNYLLNIFSPQIVNELIGIKSYIPRFIETDNKLYQESRDYSIKLLYHSIAEKDIIIEKESDLKFVCIADKILYEEDKTESDGAVYKFNYVYEKIDDKWIFTEFPIIKPFTEKEWDYSKFNNEYPIVSEIKDLDIIQQKWEEARDIMYSFNHDPFETGIFSYSIAIGDIISYMRVYNNQFKTLKDVESYLSTLFSKEIVEGYISGDFISIDGLLYRYHPEGEKGSWAVNTKKSHVEKINDKKYVYTWNFYDIYPEGNDGEKEVYSVDYTYEYIDGRWVFTDFPYYGHAKLKNQ